MKEECGLANFGVQNSRCWQQRNEGARRDDTKGGGEHREKREKETRSKT
jgi:hypothetical protein